MSMACALPFRSNRRGFTLVELVVVILILGILAAVAAPRMFDKASDARESSTRQSLVVIRDAIQLYRAENGSYPALATLADDLKPFINGSFPAAQAATNPNNEVADASAQDPITAVVGEAKGWAYNPTTGEFVINDASYIGW